MIRIGTRGSKLALAQANWVSAELTGLGLENEIIILKTKGDIVQDRFDKMEGKGFFTREIEDALLENRIDVAVHCLKDLPTDEPEGLSIAAITERENPYDVMVSTRPIELHPDGAPQLGDALIGTSSNRRIAALQRFSSAAKYTPIRGNVPTRLQKMEQGDADMIVLARAGLNRLNTDLSGFTVVDLLPPVMVPAPGQGALALQIRTGDTVDLSHFHHEHTARCVKGERKILNSLDGGCQLPLGVLIAQAEQGFLLELFLAVEGKQPLAIKIAGDSPESLTEQALTLVQEYRQS